MNSTGSNSAVDWQQFSRGTGSNSAVALQQLSRTLPATQPWVLAAVQPWLTAELPLYYVIQNVLESFTFAFQRVSALCLCRPSCTLVATCGRGLAPAVVVNYKTKAVCCYET